MLNKKYDLTVIGGGPAGISCAYNAAKMGLKTLLVEKNNYLGGQITGALVIPMMKSASEDINIDFFNRLIENARQYDAQITYDDGNSGWFNPVMLKIIFEKMLQDTGVEILFETELINANCSDKKIKFINIKSRDLSLQIESKYYVDSTGDSKFCEIAKCNFIDDNGKYQPSSLRFIVSNVNLEKFSTQILKLDTDRNVTTACRIGSEIHLSTAYTFDSNKVWGLSRIFHSAILAKDLEYSDTAYFQTFTIAGMPNSLAFNCPRLQNTSETDIFSYSNSLIRARATILRLHNFMKKYFDGFNNSFVSQIAYITGVRVSKRPKTKYIYKLDDIKSGKNFQNIALAADYPIDIHSNKQNSSTLQAVKKYFLPIEALMSADFDNLFVAGRNLGAEFEAQAALRIQKSCLSMGEAVAKYIHKILQEKEL